MKNVKNKMNIRNVAFVSWSTKMSKKWINMTKANKIAKNKQIKIKTNNYKNYNINNITNNTKTTFYSLSQIAKWPMLVTGLPFIFIFSGHVFIGLNCAVRDIFSKPIKSAHKQSLARALHLRRVWVSAQISAGLLKVVWDWSGIYVVKQVVPMVVKARQEGERRSTIAAAHRELNSLIKKDPVKIKF